MRLIRGQITRFRLVRRLSLFDYQREMMQRICSEMAIPPELVQMPVPGRSNFSVVQAMRAIRDGRGVLFFDLETPIRDLEVARR